MHQSFTLALLAIVAEVSIAAPTPSKALVKRSFKVPVKGHGKKSPGKAMCDAYQKYGWEIVFQDPFDGFENGWPAPSAGYGYGGASSSAPAWGGSYSSAAWDIWGSSILSSVPSATASAPGSFSFSFAPSSVPSSAPVGSSGVPSSAPDAPSSAAPSSPASSIVPSSPPSSGVPSSPASSIAPSSPASSAAPSAPAPSASSPPSGDGSDEGEVSATPDDNEASYIAPVSIGGQTLDLNFDTGSADLWVYNSGMSSSLTAGHKLFDPSKSSTFTNYQGGTWEIQYGDGSTAQGSVGFDTVTIGGVVAQKQCIELAETVSGNFLSSSFSDGLLGLAFSSINQVQPQQQKTFFENVADSLEQPLFTADLEEDASGTYEFGSIDASKYTGEIHYAPVDNSAGFWQIQSESFTVGGTRQSCGTCSPTIADTGTSLLIWDNDVVEAYYSEVQGAELSQDGYVYPCSSTLPDLGIAIGDYIATIKGADVTYAEAGSGYCFGGIQPNEGNGINIIGDVLLKQFFAVFDGGQMRFGVATKP